MNLPRNAQAILDLRAGGMKPEHPVIVSFVGHTGFENPHVFVENGERCDWRFLHGLQAQIFVKPGVNAKHAMKAIFDEVDLMQSYPALVDVELKQLAFVVGNKPLKTWPVKSGTELWKEFFE